MDKARSSQRGLVMARALVVCCLLVVIAPVSSSLDTEPDFCLRESFNVTCPPSHVILMTSARYGRMRPGRCISREVGYIGCFADVLPHLDTWCSGRQHCHFPVKRLIDVSAPCNMDVTSYLEASHACVPVATGPDGKCPPEGSVEISDMSGYLASSISDSVGVGTQQCPWMVRLGENQKVQLSTFTFHSDETNPLHACSMYAVIEDSSVTREVPLCKTGGREVPLYTSRSSLVMVFFLKMDDVQHNFLIKYQALGCRKITPPRLAYVEQTERTAMVKCNGSQQETWYLTCQDNTWIGDVGNCTQEATWFEGNHATNTQWNFPYGVLIAVLIGVVLGVLIGTTLLAFVYVCYKKKRPEHGHRPGGSTCIDLEYEDTPGAEGLGHATLKSYHGLIKAGDRGGTTGGPDFAYDYSTSFPMQTRDPSDPKTMALLKDTDMPNYNTQSGGQHNVHIVDPRHIYESAHFTGQFRGQRPVMTTAFFDMDHDNSGRELEEIHMKNINKCPAHEKV